jgi:peptidyl-prolyl cis-trans isomerase SurA
MKSLFSFIILSVCFVFVATAQDSNDVLFELDKEPYKVDPFIESFKKNSELISSNNEDIEDYLRLYINFQLKLKSAYEQNLDTLQTFKNEFEGYYKQIADNYISNGEVAKAMVEETYDRTKTEVKASHILLNLSKYEKDTSKIYQKALMLKKRAENGEDFATLATQFSEDPSAKSNGGDINWFNTFQMLYEFEDAAYKLKVGEISNPIRTDFGYHIIKKTGERASKGKLSTAHILIVKKDSTQNPEEHIQKIYEKLKKGEDFHDLAKQYSQDKYTADSGGYVSPFSIGGLTSKVYENKAFQLEEIGDYTEPFQTKFGWHIVKLIDVEPVKTYEELKDELEKRLKTSSRSKLLVSKIKEDLESRYTVEINPRARFYFINELDSTFSKGKWKFESAESLPSGYVFRVENREIDYKTFGEYLERVQRGLSKLPENKIVIENALEDLIYSELLPYHKTKLPEIDSDFESKINEYKNGILIFDYMKANVWEPISKDSASLKEYYNLNKKEFITEQRAKGQLYTSKLKTSLKTLSSKLESKTDLDTIPVPITRNIISEDISVTKSSSKLPEKFIFEEGVSLIYKHLDQYLLMNVNEIQPSQLLKFQEVRGEIISILQDKREKELISELRSRYTVKLNEDVFNTLKQKFEK